jgi:repressor LexA
MNTRKKLSKRQRQVLDFIKTYWKEKGFSPSFADIAQGLGLPGSTIKTYLEILRQKEYLTWQYFTARSIRILNVVEQGED